MHVNSGKSPLAIEQPVIVPPRLSDGALVSALVAEVGGLEVNTGYAYLLLCHHFSDTCAIAKIGEHIVGCVLGYRIPAHPEVLFIWQVGTRKEQRGTGLASRILDELISRPGLQEITSIQLTIAPSNEASSRLFRSFADRHGWAISDQEGFLPEHFGTSTHEEERLVTITRKKEPR